MSNFAPKPSVTSGGLPIAGQRLAVAGSVVKFTAFNALTTAVVLDVQGADMYVTFDATAPSSTNGAQLYAGNSYYWNVATAQAAQFIEQSSAGTVQAYEFIAVVGLDSQTTQLPDSNILKPRNYLTGSGLFSALTVTGNAVVYGTLSIGNSALVSDSFPQVSLSTLLNGTFGGVGIAHGYLDSSTFETSVAGGAYASFDARITVTGSVNYDHVVGFQSIPILSSYSATLSKAYGFLSNRTVGSGSTLTQMFHYAAGSQAIGGTIGTEYGFYCDTLATAGTSWAFYAVSDQSFFGGGIMVGSTAGGNIYATTNAGTNLVYDVYTNTGGNMVFGIEGSAGSQIITGAAAYGTCLTAGATRSLFLGAGAGALGLTLNPSGNATFAGTITDAGTTNGAAAWKHGPARTSTALVVSTTTGIQINVAGTTYTLAVLTTNP